VHRGTGSEELVVDEGVFREETAVLREKEEVKEEKQRIREGRVPKVRDTPNARPEKLLDLLERGLLSDEVVDRRRLWAEFLREEKGQEE
jgi:hypothetical protein